MTLWIPRVFLKKVLQNSLQTSFFSPNRVVLCTMAEIEIEIHHAMTGEVEFSFTMLLGHAWNPCLVALFPWDVDPPILCEGTVLQRWLRKNRHLKSAVGDEMFVATSCCHSLGFSVFKNHEYQ